MGEKKHLEPSLANVCKTLKKLIHIKHLAQMAFLDVPSEHVLISWQMSFWHLLSLLGSMCGSCMSQGNHHDPCPREEKQSHLPNDYHTVALTSVVMKGLESKPTSPTPCWTHWTLCSLPRGKTGHNTMPVPSLSTPRLPTWNRGTHIWECYSMTTAQHSTPLCRTNWSPGRKIQYCLVQLVSRLPE